MDHFIPNFERLILVERGYADNPLDSGGKTRYGITERVARANGYTGVMQHLPLGEAQRIYRAQYWDLLKLESVARLAPSIAAEMFDTGVNMGQRKAVEILQRWLNGLNRHGSLWGDMVVDGLMGPVTLEALAQFLRARNREGEAVLFSVMNGTQAEFYLNLVERREKDEEFLWGWARTRVARANFER